ncbi:hypothetical protein [Streptomyces sp. NPDC001307]|uniref:hypothetical protein n=1 Tax=Streptomyces sp. NPDC001307 TaxID=3364560 RepID=UPI003676597C
MSPSPPPRHVAGTLIPQGADGTRLSEEAADVLDNRSSDNASGGAGARAARATSGTTPVRPT